MKYQMASLTSQIHVNREEMRARVSAIQYRMEATTTCSHEETEAAVQSIRSELEETIDIRSKTLYVNHWT
jgi:hypothetical protein